MIRKILCCAVILILFVSSVSGASAGSGVSADAGMKFLEEHYSVEEMTDAERAFWDSTVISLVTISKGDELYQWFGHSAISVQVPGHESITYNYGYFSFGDDFYLNFAMGRLYYFCDADYTRYEVSRARYEERTMTETVLNLSPEQKKAVVMFLDFNSTPPDNTYLYHYYLDNCATRIRDVIDMATDGGFGRWARTVPGLSFRKSNSRVLANNLFFHWLLDIIESARIDNEDATLWEEMYQPAVLQKAVEEYPGNLAGEKVYRTDFRETDPRKPDFDTPQDYTLKLFLISFAFSALLVLLYRKVPVLYGIADFTVLLVLGFAGCLLLFMMVFTTHDVVWNNENIVFLNPLLIAAAALSIKPSRHAKALKCIWLALAGATLVLVILKIVLPSVFAQKNTALILAFMPLALANLFVVRSARISGSGAAAGKTRKSRK